MKVKKQRVLLVLLTAVMLLCLAVALGFSRVRVSAEEWLGEELKEEYALGTVLTVPDYEMKVGEQTVKATSSLTLPDGLAVNEKTVKLDKAGKYVLTYFASVNGKQYNREFTFMVGYGLYTFSNEETTSVTYGTYTEYGSEATGLAVRLASGDSLDFAAVIDTNGMNGQQDIINFFVTPDEKGVADFNKLIVTLTDIEDSSVYLRFEANRWTLNSAGASTTYNSAGGNGQAQVGDEGGTIHTNDNLGTYVSHTWVAQTEEGWGGPRKDMAPSSAIMGFSFDAETKQAFVSSTSPMGTRKMISDMDDPEYYSELWSGFKSGKVRVSVSASGYQGVTANFFITNLFGAELTENNVLFDTGKPVITIDSEYDVLPEAVLNRAYQLPAATAFDDYSGAVNVTCKIYYNYNSESPVSVNVEGNTFTPKWKGEYTIVYSATDYSGVTATEIVTVHAGGEIPPIEIELPAQRTETVEIGHFVEVSAAAASGGSGNKTVTVSATNGTTTLDVTDGFRPESVGEWTVTYTAVDYVGTVAQKSYTVTCTAAEKPFFMDTVALPMVFISGQKYELPVLYAADYTSGSRQEMLADVTVEDTNGVKTYRAGETFAPVVRADGEKVKISYTAGTGNRKTEYGTLEVPAILVDVTENMFRSKYLFGEGFTVYERETPESARYTEGLRVEADEAGENVGWTFANALLANDFSVNLSTLTGSTLFDALEIVLADAENPAVTVKLRILLGEDKTTLVVGDYTLDLSYSLKQKTTFEVAYANGKLSFENIDRSATVSIVIENFEGFPSGKIYASVNMLGAEKGAAYMIYSVSESTITYRNDDPFTPLITVFENDGGNKSFNSVFTVSKAIAGDVFAPNTSVSVTVYAPDGSVVADEEGLLLENVPTDREYRFKLTSFGQYEVLYTAKELDWVEDGYPLEYGVYVYVPDETSPEIKITSHYTETAKVGDTLILPDFEVSDNISAAENITVTCFAVNAYGKVIKLSGNSIVCEYEGTYEFRIMAMDEFGNVSLTVLKVEVTR